MLQKHPQGQAKALRFGAFSLSDFTSLRVSDHPDQRGDKLTDPSSLHGPGRGVRVERCAEGLGTEEARDSHCVGRPVWTHLLTHRPWPPSVAWLPLQRGKEEHHLGWVMGV